MPEQRNGYDCGLFAVMHFFCIARESVIDFHPGDMDMIKKWAMNILLNFDKNKDFKYYVEWLVKKMSGNRLGGLKLIVNNFCKLNISLLKFLVTVNIKVNIGLEIIISIRLISKIVP